MIGCGVTRNLDTTAQVRKFYRLLYQTSNVAVIDQPVPHDLVTKYAQQGLPEKADAVLAQSFNSACALHCRITQSGCDCQAAFTTFSTVLYPEYRSPSTARMACSTMPSCT